MKSSLTVFVLVILLLNILSGCAPRANQFKGTASEHDIVAGFWVGLWQGFIAPFVFASRVGSKPAMQGRLKTGHMEWPRTRSFLSRFVLIRQVRFGSPAPRSTL